jgi:transcriptional regulator of arginine metabolism
VTKRFRQTEILKLIRRRPVHTQEEIAAALQKLGVEVAQVTLSRDIHELGIVKGPQGYFEPLQTAAADEERAKTLKKAVGEFVRDIKTAQNLVILQTASGNSAPVAYALDKMGWPEIVGTIAGEDTVFAASPDARQALKVRERLLSLLR